MKGDNIKAERDFLESGLRAMIDLRRIGSRIPLDEGAGYEFTGYAREMIFELEAARFFNREPRHMKQPESTNLSGESAC